MAKQRVWATPLSEAEIALVDQRCKQQGISRAEYFRECLYLEWVLSGDLEVTKFVARRVGRSVKAALLERFQGAELADKVSVLAE